MNFRLLLTTLFLASCSTIDVAPIPLTNADIIIECHRGETCSASMGQPILTRCQGPWRETYTLNHPIQFEGIQTASGSGWFAYVRNPITGNRYMTHPEFVHGHIGLEVDSKGNFLSPYQAVQVGGKRRGRTWKPTESVQNLKFELSGCIGNKDSDDLNGWTLQYVDHVRGVARFTVQEIDWNGQKNGDVTYSHDFNAGNEIVFRGVRLRVNSIGTDGVINYTVVDAR